MSARAGTVLIVVAGVAALLASTALAFLVRMRADGEEMAIVLREAQARIMLVAACTYVQEASRLGWDDPATSVHEEAFGWVDVRDGRLGPKTAADGVDDDARFPIGHVARCPMHVPARAPSAIRLTASYNPIRTWASPDPVPVGDPAFGRPFLRMPDPQPLAENGWPGLVDDAAFAAWRRGDRRPRPETTGLAWFRCYRDGDVTFVVTCGAGGTLGYRDWAEVVADGARDAFGDAATFADLRREECLRWYLVAWSAAIMTNDYHHLDNGMAFAPDHYVQFPHNNSQYLFGGEARRGPGHNRNMVGTIAWIQRLREPPTRW